MRHTPCKTQWLRCSVVARSASNTRPTPMAFLLSEVTYTGVLKVFWSLRRWASMGMTFMTGRSWINCLGDCRIRQQFSRSQAAPSRYRPSMKQPANQNQCCFIKCSPWIQWKSRTFILFIFIGTKKSLDYLDELFLWHHRHSAIVWLRCREWTCPVASHSYDKWPVPEQSGKTLGCGVQRATWQGAHPHSPLEKKGQLWKKIRINSSQFHGHSMEKISSM